jgi:transcriptional antiterminator NusG
MGEIVKKWYVVRAVSGKEKKVKEYLELEITRMKLNDYVNQVLIPTEKVFKIQNGKKVNKEKAFLPGYVLIEAALVGEVSHVIKGIPNVIGFLGTVKGGEPVPMRLSEVNRILGKEIGILTNPLEIGLQSGKMSFFMVPVETKITHGTWDGKPVLFGISRDISERLKNQSAIVESEKKFRELTEYLPLPLFETDMQGIVTYINLEGQQFFSLQPQELQQGVSAFSFCIPDELDKALANQKLMFEPD